jgi:hypothetical protein
MSALCGVFVAAALVAPRLFGGGEGFAPAAGATLMFLTLLCVAGVLSLMLFLRTVRVFRTLSFPARLLGLSPGLLIVTGVIMLIAFLRF